MRLHYSTSLGTQQKRYIIHVLKFKQGSSSSLAFSRYARKQLALRSILVGSNPTLFNQLFWVFFCTISRSFCFRIGRAAWF